MKTALMCIANDEDNYLYEWINYHRKLGFDDVFIYQHDWRSKFNKTNIAKFVEFDGINAMIPAYNNFIEQQYNNYDFAAIFDVDEFLVLK